MLTVEKVNDIVKLMDELSGESLCPTIMIHVLRPQYEVLKLSKFSVPFSVNDPSYTHEALRYNGLTIFAQDILR